MIKRFRKSQDKKFYRVNERIFAHTLRVLDTDGKQIGVISRLEAFKKAQSRGLDLVEIAPKAQPPVAKIIDFKKFLYQEAKRKKEEKKKSKTVGTKEVRLGPFMSENDLLVMEKRSREFLLDGNKVRFVVFFSGRQITHPEFGHKVLDKIIGDLSDVSKVERERHLEGRKLIILVSPDKKGKDKKGEVQNVKEKNQEIDK